MAIQQVGGQGVYVITGSNRDPRRTSNGQSWADLVTKQKFMLYQSAYDQAMREYNQGLITEKERQAKMAQIQKQIDAERGAIDKLKLKQLDINQARELENQRMKAKESLTTVTRGSTGGTGGTRGQKIPSKNEYLSDLRKESRDINTDTVRLQRLATGLQTEITKLQAMAGSGNFPYLEGAAGEQEQQYNNYVQQLQDNRTRQGKITEELNKVAPMDPNVYLEHYKTNVGLPIQVGGTSGGGGKRTTSQYYRTPVDELGSVSLDPQVAAKEQRIRELQEEMQALGVTPDVDVIDRTREIYAEKFGQPPRRRLRDRFGRRQPVEQPVVEQAVEETVEAPVQQNDMSRFQQPDLTSQIANRRLQDLTAQDMPEESVQATRQATRQARVRDPEQDFMDQVAAYEAGEDLEFQPSPVERVDLPTTDLEQITGQYTQPLGTAERYDEPRQETVVSSPMTRAMDRMEARRRGEDFRFEPSTPEVTDEFPFQPSTPEVVDPFPFQPSTPEVVDPFPFQPSTVETVTQEQFDQPPTFEVEDPRIQPEVTEPRLSPTPTPIPMGQVRKLGRIPLMGETRTLIETDPIVSAFDKVKNLSNEEKQMTGLRLLEQAKEAYGVTSKEYLKTKSKILDHMMKVIDPAKARRIKKARQLQKDMPGKINEYGNHIRGLTDETKRMVVSLFPVDDDTKIADVESYYKNAQREIKIAITNRPQQKKALEMLDLMYLSVIEQRR